MSVGYPTVSWWFRGDEVPPVDGTVGSNAGNFRPGILLASIGERQSKQLYRYCEDGSVGPDGQDPTYEDADSFALFMLSATFAIDGSAWLSRIIYFLVSDADSKWALTFQPWEGADVHGSPFRPGVAS